MKLASHLAKSRHGVFYFRFTIRSGTTTREKRLSLNTKNPVLARQQAACLNVLFLKPNTAWEKFLNSKGHSLTLEDVVAGTASADTDFLASVMAKLGHLPPAVQEQLDGVRKLDVHLPNGLVFKNINTAQDAQVLAETIKALNLSTEALAAAITSEPQPLPTSQPATKPQEQAGTTIQEMVPRYATRRQGQLSAKALYEYGNHQRKLVQWLEVRKNSKHIPIRLVNREDIADFIADLQAKGLSNKTISQKYLAPINGLFDLAQTSGLIPPGPLPSHGHKVLTKKDLRKSEHKTGYKPFTTEELKAIFQPLLLTEAQRPADFWAPMLGLFTGARLNELCQLDTTDILQVNGIWAISFNNDTPDKSLKTAASRRVIPLHPTLIECGFLDYVEDARQFMDGRKLFPYLTYNKLDGYAATPSERWGKFLDKLQIKDPQKVFHSFRSTSNNCLKQNGVPEESRCQFVGHEHDTVNSKTYSTNHSLEYLLENVANKLTYPFLDFKALTYQKGTFSKMLSDLCTKKAKREQHEKTKQARLNRIKEN